MAAQILIVTSSAILLVVGVMHLHATFFGPDLRPRDPVLEKRMKEVPLGVSGETTVWSAWIGFNLSQSLGLILFGAFYAYLAAFQMQVLMNAPLLLWLGTIFLGGLVVIAKLYLFSIPFRVFVGAFVVYVAGALLTAG